MSHRLAQVLCAAAFVASCQYASAAPTLEDFLREPYVRDAELSPDGKHLAMIINEPTRRLVVVRNVETPEMPIVGAFADEIVRPSWLYWGNNDKLLISMLVPWDIREVRRAQKRGNFDINRYFQFSRMVSVDTDLTNMVVLMEDERNLKRNTSLSRVTNYLPNDRDHVLMAAYRNGRWILYKVNIDSGKADLVTRGSSRTYRFFNDDEGRPLYRFDYRKRSRLIEIYKFLDEDEWELVDKIPLNTDDQDGLDSRDLVALYVDNIVYRKRNENTGYYELVLVDRTTQQRRTVASLEGQDVFGALFDTRSDQLIGYRVEKDYIRDTYFDEAMQQRYDAIAAQVGNYNFEVSSLEPDKSRALVRVRGADNPRSYFLWDFETRELELLAHAYKGLEPANLSAPAVTTYSARDGTPVRAYILLPPSFEAGKAYPTIILPHGGPHARSRPEYDDFAQFLSTRGYIVVAPNFRGSVGYGEAFEVAGFKQWGGVMQDDLTDAVNFMVDKGYSDPDRICIVGGSYGGYAALMGAVKTPDLYSCAVSLNGVTHLVEQIEHDMKDLVDEDDWEEFIFDQIGHPERDRAMLDRNSPALNAAKIRIPVMIVAGTEDPIVPFKQAKLMVNALKRAEVEYEFLTLKDTGHNPFYYREDKARVFEAVEAFLATHLR